MDLPEPETPVTQVNRPRGMATSIFLRLLPEAPRRTSQSLFKPDKWTGVYQMMAEQVTTKGRGLVSDELQQFPAFEGFPNSLFSAEIGGCALRRRS